MREVNFKRLRSNYPQGICGIYDNSGHTADRYTVVFDPFLEVADGNVYWYYLAMNSSPASPQGICMSGCTVGFRPGTCGTKGWSNACGKTINWGDLPEACRTAALGWLEED